MSEWQPIETAPKGVGDEWIEILLCQTYGDDEPIYFIGFWDEELGTWIDAAMPVDSDEQSLVNPTHWMPLPEPPK